LQRLLDRLVFEVASYRHLPDECIHTKPVRWLFSQFWMVQQANWQTWTGHVTATEVALSRALAVAFSGKKKAALPPLPTWEDMSKPQASAPRKSDFVQRLERANINRQGDLQVDHGLEDKAEDNGAG
jgi:hypothetical protein